MLFVLILVVFVVFDCVCVCLRFRGFACCCNSLFSCVVLGFLLMLCIPVFLLFVLFSVFIIVCV